MGFASSIADAWVSRYARPSPEARAAVAGLAPAAVVTGGSQGIGYALARRFVEGGASVALVARSKVPLEAAAESIVRDFGMRPLAVSLDVTAPDAPVVLDQALRATGYYLDTLVNSAGIGLTESFCSQEPEEIERLIALNVTALTRLMRHALPQMLARGRGGILNVASLGGYTPGPYQAAYYASKAFVISLTEAAAFETRGKGVRVAVVAPGPVDTQFHSAMGAEGALYRRLYPAPSPERVARSAYRGFMLGRRVIVPGLLATAAAIGARIMPHPLLMPIVATLLHPGDSRTRPRN